MGKEKKKGESGEATKYITRNQVLKKLQLSLPDFRRLCILKGIYPREPNNKKKVLKGSTAPKTFYWVKDIQFLAHDPLLIKFREFKSFTKKLKKALAKKEYAMVANIKSNKPVYSLDHLIRERYPTFVDAVRDLDDALCMVLLFSRMPAVKRIQAHAVERCAKLVAEFQNYCVITNSLRKTFLSIKGIYYQAEIAGQTVTWITPYNFTQQIPSDVDFRIMLTFLEFYETLLGFVNYKLYSDENLHYPPVWDSTKDNKAVGLSAIQLQSKTESLTKMITVSENNDNKEVDEEQVAESEKRISTLKSKLAQLSSQAEKEKEKEKEKIEDSTIKENELDEFKEQGTEKEDVTQSFKKLFEGSVFYLGREVPREVLEFVIKCFGGKVGWDGEGSPFSEDDISITHQVVDRPSVANRVLSREYVQPQWIFDSVNNQRLISTSKYAPGVELPPHLSPFVVERAGDYVPKEVYELRNGEEEVGEEEIDDDGEEEVDNDDEEEEEEEDQKPQPKKKQAKGKGNKRGREEKAESEDDEEDEHQQELMAEAAGIPFSQFKSNKKAKTTKERELKKAKKESEEEKELAKIMMGKKEKRLYEKIQRTQTKREKHIQKLTEKRKRIEDEEAKTKKTKSK